MLGFAALGWLHSAGAVNSSKIPSRQTAVAWQSLGWGQSLGWEGGTALFLPAVLQQGKTEMAF